MLAETPFDITAEWSRRGYTTDPPRYVPFDIWSLKFTVECDPAVRFVTLFSVGPALGWHNVADREGREFSVRFAPRNSLHSDDLFMQFGYHQTWVTDRSFKEDPRPHVELGAGQGVTGKVVTLGSIPRFDVRFEIIGFARGDTETRRNHRWRVKPQHEDSLPERLRALTSGRQHSDAIFKQLGG